MTGDVDLSRGADLIAEPARSRILVALTSGRELSASLLAEEASVSRPTLATSGVPITGAASRSVPCTASRSRTCC